MPSETDTTGQSPALEGYYRQAELWETSRFQANPDQRLRARLIAAMIDPAVESVLDVGCGNGFVTRQLPGKRVVGLDPSPEALARFEGEKVVGTADALPFAHRSFDTVVCAEVLEHLEETVFRKAVAELDRVTGKALIIGVPYRENLRTRMTECAACGHRFHVNLHHRSFWSAKDLAVHFPGFSVGATVLLGRKTQIRWEFFRTLSYWLLGPTAHRPLAQCPKCGSGETVSYKSRKGRRIRRRFVEGLAWRLPKTLLANWMVLLLERDQRNEQG